MKLSLPTAKPRNPYALAARARRAGAHTPDAKRRRQAERQALRRELRRL